MKYRSIPKTDLKLSEIGFALGPLCSGTALKASGDGIRLLHAAFDLGINFFDASDSHQSGCAEELLASALRKQRDELVIATKAGTPTAQSNVLAGLRPEASFSPVAIKRAAEQSLKRLKTDRIDLLELHPIGFEQILDDSLWQMLETLRKEGKILHYGASVGPSLGWLYEAVDCLQIRRPAVFEHSYNLLDRYPGHDIHRAGYALLPEPFAAVQQLPEFEHGEMKEEPALETAFIVRDPHSTGLLEGRYNDGTLFPPEDPRSLKPRSWLLQGLKRTKSLNFLTGKETGRTLGQAALLWLLAEKTIASCLPTIDNLDQLREFAQAPEKMPLTGEELDRIRDLQTHHFGIEEEPASYQGTMDRENVTQ